MGNVGRGGKTKIVRPSVKEEHNQIKLTGNTWIKRRLAHGEKQHPVNVKPVSECLQRFLNDAGNASSWIEDDDVEDETCECKKFESTPHQMFGRRMERLNEYVRFYDSILEKHDM
ncbi:hypothetical protein NPIL_231051 [Nephila pilipes]|uniref:Uncharacterized protein n=1 Tax=Nephila pilipes TaxID=299642 RepID=A0A8X6UXA1_NEPPI|nr:hypothetical protein NPIL_231051 [Nephila pilipes]